MYGWVSKVQLSKFADICNGQLKMFFFFTKFEMTNIRWGGGGHNWSLLLSLPRTWAGWARVASGEDKSGEADRSGNMN